MIDDPGDLYGVSISKTDSKIEYLGTISQNTVINNPSTTIQQTSSQPKVMYNPLFLTHSTKDSEFPDLDIPSIRKNLTQSQTRFTL